MDSENYAMPLSRRSGDALRDFDMLSFLHAWMGNPSRVGAVAPSGRALAELMVSEITASTGPVIELGPGTGVFTRALMAHGVKETDLTLVESLPSFAELLRLRFPDAQVLCVDAARLRRRGSLENLTANAVVSGLPLLSLPRRKVICIVAGAFLCLRTGGALYQFTYGLRCPVPRPVLDRLGLKATCLGRVLRNIPPAAVYRITRRTPLKHTADAVFGVPIGWGRSSSIPA